MRNLEVSSGGILSNEMGGNQEIESLEIKWDLQLREAAARVYGMSVFVGEIWIIPHMECVEFATKHIPEDKFKWFIDIVSCLQFFIGESVYTEYSQRDEVHAAKVRKKK